MGQLQREILKEQLRDMIRGGQIGDAIEMVQVAKDHQEAEEFVFIVLGEEKSPPELVEAVLDTFLHARQNCAPQHGFWVHSLSHFTKILWERRMIGWIKKFNEVAFKGANELGDRNCSHRLVDDFVNYAKFADDPADFGLAPENFIWIKDEYSKERIKASPFKSEEALIRWELQQPANQFTFNHYLRVHIANIEKVRFLIRRLQELGSDTSEFSDLEKDLLNKQLKELEKAFGEELQDAGRREGLRKKIELTCVALVS